MICLGEHLEAFKDFYWIEEIGISSNAYLLAGGKVMIDAGNMPGIAREVNSQFFLPEIEAIFLTHHHYDHIGGLVELLAYCNPQIIVHRDTIPFLLINKVPFLSVMEKNGRADRVISVRGAETFRWGEVTLEVVNSPGHTSGDMCLFEHSTRSLFSGDIVFPAFQDKNFLADADPGTGNSFEMRDSLRRLLAYPVSALLPGHGSPVLQGAHEHVKNSYLQMLLEMNQQDEEKAWIELIEALIEYHRSHEALEAVDFLLKKYPASDQALILKGMISLEENQFEGALQAFAEALRIFPEHPEAVVGKGMALIALDRSEEAMQLPGFKAHLQHTLTPRTAPPQNR